MKIIKGLAFLITTILVVSCFNPPEFPNVPEIGYDHVEFNRGATISDKDTLSVFITFKDGNGDLGLDPQDARYNSAPFHPANFYQGNNGELLPLSTFLVDTFTVLDIPDPTKGDLVFYKRKRQDPTYNFLPELSSPGCDYEFTRTLNLVVERADAATLVPAIDTTGLKKVRFFDTEQDIFRTFFVVVDTLYFTRNPDHFNISVDFLVKDPSSTNPDHPGFTEFDWGAAPYCAPFDGRFPFLSDNVNALEGILRYDMSSYGFISVFGVNKPIMLRIQIRDRAGNLSNTVFTEPFTL
jgi:hypothetical protein